MPKEKIIDGLQHNTHFGQRMRPIVFFRLGSDNMHAVMRVHGECEGCGAIGTYANDGTSKQARPLIATC